MCDGQVQTPLCEIYSRFYIPTIIQIGYILTDLLKKMQGRRFSYTPNSFILGARSLGVAAEKNHVRHSWVRGSSRAEESGCSRPKLYTTTMLPNT